MLPKQRFVFPQANHSSPKCRYRSNCCLNNTGIHLVVGVDYAGGDRSAVGRGRISLSLVLFLLALTSSDDPYTLGIDDLNFVAEQTYEIFKDDGNPQANTVKCRQMPHLRQDHGSSSHEPPCVLFTCISS